MSSFATVMDHVRDRLVANLTIPAARIDWTAIGNAPKFTPPDYTTGTASDATWVRPVLVGKQGVVPPIAGAANPGPMGIGPASPSYREFDIVGMHFAPRGGASAHFEAFVDVFNGIFHRARFGTNPVVECQDADEPVIVGFEHDLDKWYQVNAIIPGRVQDPN